MHPQELACVLKTCEWSRHRVEWNRDGRLEVFVDAVPLAACWAQKLYHVHFINAYC